MSYHKIFVYGTLKKGEPNHHWLSKEENGYGRFIGTAKTVEKYPLIIGTRYNIPFLLYSPGKGENVVGEVYEVDDHMLEKLDSLEEHPTFYEREVHPVILLPGEDKMDSKGSSISLCEAVDCWIYFIKRFRSDLLQQEFYTNYKSKGSHGKEYSVSNDESSPSDLW